MIEAKKPVWTSARLALVGVLALGLSLSEVVAQSAAPPDATNSAAAPVQLSAGAWDILKLVRAGVNESTILAFINGPGRTYNLSSSEILYLRDQGASDAVITAALNKKAPAAAPAESTPAPAANPSAPVSVPSTSAWAASTPNAAAAPAPAPTPAPAPVYVQPQTVYVSPPPPVYYYPDYYYYPRYYSPPVSLSFGFGFGGYHSDHYHGYGGYHGGGYHGGHP